MLKMTLKDIKRSNPWISFLKIVFYQKIGMTYLQKYVVHACKPIKLRPIYIYIYMSVMVNNKDVWIQLSFYLPNAVATIISTRYVVNVLMFITVRQGDLCSQ